MYIDKLHPLDLSRRLNDLQKVHTTEVAKLQQSLQEESERRTVAQRSLEELRGEVAIGIDDSPLTGSASLAGGGGEGEGNKPEHFSE